MVQPGCELDLPQKPIGAERRGEIGMQNLECYEAFVLRILREIHGCHSTPAELAVDRVVIGERVANSFERSVVHQIA